MKRVLAIILMAAIALMSIPMVTAYAESEISKEAQICHDLGILEGDESGFNAKYLAKSTSKLQAAIVMLKLLGRYETAKNYNYGISNFSDADQMAWIEGRNILSYLKDNPSLGWQGNPDGTFGVNDMATPQMLYKVLLEVLGYKYDKTGEGDFTWEETIEFAKSIGMGRIAGWLRVTNDDLAACIVEALYTPVNGGSDDEILLYMLAEENPDFAARAEAAGLLYSDPVQSIIQPDPVDVEYGEAPNLPSKVTVVYESGRTEERDVVWDYVDTTVEGSRNIIGYVDGLDVFATILVNVIPRDLDFTVGTSNLKEITVAFNKPVDKTKAVNKNNYSVKSGSSNLAIDSVILSDDNKTVYLLLNTSLEQQASVEVTVRSGVGLENDVTKKIAGVVDEEAPMIEKVEAIGNKMIRITFNEPVMQATNTANYTLDDKSLASYSGANVSVKGRVADITMFLRLTYGTHGIMASSNIIDYAGNKLVPETVEFQVVKDTTPPEVELVSATQTEVTVRFSEPVERLYNSKVTTASKSTVTSVEAEDDLKTYKITFSPSFPLPANGTEITFSDVTDYSNNKKTLKLKVVPVIDTTPPEYLGYIVEDQRKIIIQYSEPVTTAGTYLLKDIKGDVISLSTPSWYMVNGIDTTRIVLQRSENAPFPAGDYILQIDNVPDYSPLGNKLTQKTVGITILDQTPPEVLDVRISGQKLFITFNEKISESSAIAKSNYRYIENIASLTLPTGSLVALLADGQTVEITFPSGFNMSSIKALQVENIADLLGNIMGVTVKTAPFGSVDTTPKITAVQITGRDTITLSLNSRIDPTTINTEDFIISANEDQLEITSIEYNQNDMKILLRMNAEFSTSGLYQGAYPVLFKTVNSPRTANVYGQSLQRHVAFATDGYAPYITGITTSLSGSNTIVVLTLSENVKTTNKSGNPLTANELNQFIVLVDGEVKEILGSRYDDGSDSQAAKITLIIAGDYTGKQVDVKFYARPANTLTDGANNPLQNRY